MQTILITGGCGYLGSQLIRDLALDDRLKGATIRILDNMQSGRYHALMGLPRSGRYQFIEGDLLDPAVIRLALQDVDTVIHLAAIVRTPMSFENPTWMEQINHWGTNHLVDACVRTGVARLIYASSAAVYGPGGPYTEASPCRPQGPYAQAKHHGEKTVSSAAERGLQTVILRLGTLYGCAAAMRFDAFVNRFAYLAGVGRSLTVYGDGEQRRPVIHVRDASGVIRHFLVHSQLLTGAVVNTVGEMISVLDVVEAICALKPGVAVHFTEQDIRTHFSFDVDNSMLIQLGYHLQVTLQEGVEELLGQFANFEDWKMQPVEFE